MGSPAFYLQASILMHVPCEHYSPFTLNPVFSFLMERLLFKITSFIIVGLYKFQSMVFIALLCNSN